MPAKLDQASFLKRCEEAHGDRYDYSKAIYTNNLASVQITCPEHGEFTQRASNHMLGRGCPLCKAQKTSERCSDTLEAFLSKAKSAHGDTYDYSLVSYSRSNEKVEIVCREHGAFWQKPNAHISRRNGCPKCAGKSMSTSDFIGKAVAMHGNKYDYSKTAYKLIKERVTVTCKKHGDFEQIAEGHLIGRGCPACWHESYASEQELELREWIESLGISVVPNDRSAISSGLEIDILIPSLNLGIEYNGCYWHSDKLHKNRRQQEFKHVGALRSGIRIISVWDYDWKHRKDAVKNHLLHAIGLSTAEKVGARQCSVCQITHQQANMLYQTHHIQGACRGGVISLGLVHGGVVVAAMTFTQGGTRRGKAAKGEWELARYATQKVVRGGASKLFSHFIRISKAEVVWSFSDNQHFTGKLYSTLGFKCDGVLPADYRVVHPRTLQSWHKSLWQRKSIPARLRELGSSIEFDPESDPRTEEMIQNEAGVLRVWDSGKTRWKWQG